MAKTVELAKAIITEEVEKAGCVVRQVLLFGSRARGDSRQESDWDFYVVVDQNLPFHKREDLASRIVWRLAHEDIFADLFIQSETVVESRKEDTGYLTYYAIKEGVEV
jgi:predicted nucleotidyltransferase